MQEPFSKLLLFSACSEPSTSTFLWKSITPIPYFPPLSCLSCPLSPHDVCQRVVRSECQQVQMFKFNLRVPPPPRICSSQFQRTKQSDKNIRKCVTILSPPPRKRNPWFDLSFDSEVRVRFDFLHLFQHQRHCWSVKFWFERINTSLVLCQL